MTPTITTPCPICRQPVEAVVSEDASGLLTIDLDDPMAAHMATAHPQEVP